MDADCLIIYENTCNEAGREMRVLPGIPSAGDIIQPLSDDIKCSSFGGVRCVRFGRDGLVTVYVKTGYAGLDLRFD